MLEIILKLQKKQALPCCCFLLKAVKTIDNNLICRKITALHYEYVLFQVSCIYIEKEILLQVGRGASMLCMSECTAYWLPRWALFHGLLLLTLVMWLGAPNVASCSKWPFWNNPVVMNGCQIVDWKLQALQENSVVLSWHPVLKVGGHQQQSCPGSVSWLVY